MNLFLCLPDISLGRCCQKSFVRSGGFGKKIKKRGNGHIQVAILSIELGFKPSAHHVRANPEKK